MLASLCSYCIGYTVRNKLLLKFLLFVHKKKLGNAFRSLALLTHIKLTYKVI